MSEHARHIKQMEINDLRRRLEAISEFTADDWDVILDSLRTERERMQLYVHHGIERYVARAETYDKLIEKVEKVAAHE